MRKAREVSLCSLARPLRVTDPEFPFERLLRSKLVTFNIFVIEKLTYSSAKRQKWSKNDKNN